MQAKYSHFRYLGKPVIRFPGTSFRVSSVDVPAGVSPQALHGVTVLHQSSLPWEEIASDILYRRVNSNKLGFLLVLSALESCYIKCAVHHTSNDPKQMAKADALREANKLGGLKGALHPDAVDFNVEKTLEARNQVLSDKSVIGNKLTRDLSKASNTIDVAESVAKKAGVFGVVTGPVIGSVTEIAKLDENATTAEQVSAGIVGALKTVDNAIIGGTAGAAVG
jgi:hypothetical protein